MPVLWPLIFAAVLCADNVRTWTDPAGQFSVEASLVEVIDQQASLKKPDATAIWVPVSRLSQADREYLNGVHARRVAGNKKGIALRRAYLKKHQKSGNKKGIAYEVKFITMLTTERTSLRKGDIPRPIVSPPLPKKPPPPVRILNPLNLVVGYRGRLDRLVTYNVLQIVDDGVFVSMNYNPRLCLAAEKARYTRLFFSGVSTSKLVDGAKFVPPPFIHVKGVKKGKTVLGSTASVLHLVPAKR